MKVMTLTLVLRHVEMGPQQREENTPRRTALKNLVSVEKLVG